MPCCSVGEALSINWLLGCYVLANCDQLAAKVEQFNLIAEKTTNSNFMGEGSFFLTKSKFASTNIKIRI
jgi:hypothetical protein